MNLTLGSHLPISKGLHQAMVDATAIDATAMQIFTGNPRGGRMKTYDDATYSALDAQRKDACLTIVAHAPYTINLASTRDDVREFGEQQLIQGLEHAKRLGADAVVVHCGAHTGSGIATGLERLAGHLRHVLERMPEGVRLLLETMSGSGSELGFRFEHMAHIRTVLENPPALGVCLDTCHLHAAGYNLAEWPAVRADMETHFPFDLVGCIHLNDSKMPRGSKKDRHEQLGKGTLGWDGLLPILSDPDCQKIPWILETPNELEGWAEEIEEIRRRVG